MPNKTYDNFFLANEIEDQYNSHLDLVQFCTVDNSLTGTAGMDYKVHVYKATDGTEKLTKGEGNTKTIEADFTEKVSTKSRTSRRRCLLRFRRPAGRGIPPSPAITTVTSPSRGFGPPTSWMLHRHRNPTVWRERQALSPPRAWPGSCGCGPRKLRLRPSRHSIASSTQ